MSTTPGHMRLGSLARVARGSGFELLPLTDLCSSRLCEGRDTSHFGMIRHSDLREAKLEEWREQNQAI
jgi:hypothetical protein